MPVSTSGPHQERPGSAIDAVVFDFGNVLATIDLTAMCRPLARRCRLSAEAIVGRIWGTEIERCAETGVWSSREHHQRIREAIGADASWTYEEFLQEFLQGIAANPEGVEALRFAHSRGKRIFVLSNTSYVHARWMFAQEEIVTLTESFVLSFKVGAMKPDPAIWRHLLGCSGLEAGRCLYVDDVSRNCEAASSLGFATVAYVKGQTRLLQEIGRAL